MLCKGHLANPAELKINLINFHEQWKNVKNTYKNDPNVSLIDIYIFIQVLINNLFFKILIHNLIFISVLENEYQSNRRRMKESGD